MLVYVQYVQPMMMRHERRLSRLFERVQRDATELVQTGVQMGLGRLFSILAQVHGRKTSDEY